MPIIDRSDLARLVAKSVDHFVPYKCEHCGKLFRVGMQRCLVIHGPGECCHEYDEEIEIKPKEVNPDSEDD